MPEDREIPDNIGSELRQGAGREWLEEAAEDERLTELLRRRQRDLSEVARELVHRGDHVRAELRDRSFSGNAVFAGTDFVTVETDESVVDVRVEVAIWTVEKSHSGGHEQTQRPQSLKARLAELAASGEQVRLVTTDGRAHIGAIEVVAGDHLEVAGEAHATLVPLRLIAAVIRPIPRQ
jgi:hypothetical protein